MTTEHDIRIHAGEVEALEIELKWHKRMVESHEAVIAAARQVDTGPKMGVVPHTRYEEYIAGLIDLGSDLAALKDDIEQELSDLPGGLEPAPTYYHPDTGQRIA